jgi:hypothetical protein
MAKTDEAAKTKKSNKKSVAKPKNNGSFEAVVHRSSDKDKISKNSSKSSGAGLASWPRCEGCKKKMVYDEESQARWYCKTCDGCGVD